MSDSFGLESTQRPLSATSANTGCPAERNLRNTKVLTPIDGVATQVAQIELGRVAPASSTPAFAWM